MTLTLLEVSCQLYKVQSNDQVTGIASVYARGSTAAIMIQENWDQSVQNDVITLLNKLIPSGIWEHDHQDNNGDAHLKSGLIGASETIPIIDGNPGYQPGRIYFFVNLTDHVRKER